MLGKKNAVFSYVDLSFSLLLFVEATVTSHGLIRKIILVLDKVKCIRITGAQDEFSASALPDLRLQASQAGRRG